MFKGVKRTNWIGIYHDLKNHDFLCFLDSKFSKNK
jgi:hypothetical protein